MDWLSAVSFQSQIQDRDTFPDACRPTMAISACLDQRMLANQVNSEFNNQTIPGRASQSNLVQEFHFLMSLPPCLRSSSSRLFTRGFSTQEIAETLKGSVNNDPLSILPANAKLSSFRRKVAESSNEYVVNEEKVSVKAKKATPSTPITASTFTPLKRIALNLSKVELFASNLLLARPKKRKNNSKKISQALNASLFAIGQQGLLF